MTAEGRRRPGYPVARVVASGLTGRRLQTIVIGLVLLISTGTWVLALTLLADSGAPFDRAFAARPGANVTAAVDPSLVTAAQLAVYVPFVVAFCVIGLVLSVLIVTNVVSGAVAAGYSRIGILKSIGFTPGQVVAVYTALGVAPAAAGCLGGVLVGNWLARPLLSRAASFYGVGVLGVPAWADAAGSALMCGLTAVAAVVPALRAGRLSTVQALAAGRAPRADHGYAAHRLTGRLPLPRPVTMGLAAPFARPARTAATLAAVLLGTTAVTFAVGLNTSLDRVQAAMDLTGTVQVHAFSLASRQQNAVQAAIGSQPGTLHYAAEVDTDVDVAGLAQQVQATAFRGAADWTGYPMIAGRWYSVPGQADVPTGFLTATGTRIGDIVIVSFAGQRIPVRIVGVVFGPQNHGLSMLTDWQTLARADRDLAPSQYAIGLRPGTSVAAYASALRVRLGPGYGTLRNGVSSAISRLLWLIGGLTVLLAIEAALGVLSTVLLQTRERRHDMGVFRAVGMTPRQAVAMVVCSAAATGLAAGVVAVPAGIALHHYVLPRIGAAVGTGLPASFLNVYGGVDVLELALAGLIIAVAGALLPAGLAAGTPVSPALRAE